MLTIKLLQATRTPEKVASDALKRKEARVLIQIAAISDDLKLIINTPLPMKMKLFQETRTPDKVASDTAKKNEAYKKKTENKKKTHDQKLVSINFNYLIC